jgi:hypothetical protein
MPTLIDRDMYQDNDPDAGHRPHTVSVLTVLMVTSVVFSYLIAYALPQTMLAAGMIEPWSPYNDPRARWMATAMFVILGSFVSIWGFVRMLSVFQFRRIDAMGQD